MTRARRLRPFVWLTAGALIVLASGVDTRVHASRLAPAREGAAQIGGPAPGGGTNVALASAGAVASASSTYASGYAASGVINGDRAGVNWGNGGGWNDLTWGSFPDWVEVNFAGSYSISQVNVFAVQDTFWAPAEPTSTQTFTAYGVRSFDVQYWTGTAWATVPGGVTGNTLVWRTVTFPAVTTQKIRVVVTGAADGYSRLTEIEAYGDAAAPPPPELLSTADIVRFLEQATWGPTPELIEHVQAGRLRGVPRGAVRRADVELSDAAAVSRRRATTRRARTAPTCQRDNYTMYPLQNRFFVNALYGEDQLRQRVAFALHQIIVVSGVEITQPSWMAPYLQMLDRNAFGNYRAAALRHHAQPGDGQLPRHQRQHADATRTRTTRARSCSCSRSAPFELNLDGTPQLDGAGQPIPTYTRTTIDNFARVFTGWRFAPRAGAPACPNYIDPMVAERAAARHRREDAAERRGAAAGPEHRRRT